MVKTRWSFEDIVYIFQPESFPLKLLLAPLWCLTIYCPSSNKGTKYWRQQFGEQLGVEFCYRKLTSDLEDPQVSISTIRALLALETEPSLFRLQLPLILLQTDQRNSYG